MPLFPIPAVLAMVMWAALFAATGYFAIAGVGMLLLGLIVFLVRAKFLGEWPFAPKVGKPRTIP